MSASKKQRLDLLVMQQFGFTSRTDAQRAIMSGIVYQGNRCLDKVGMKVSRAEPLRLKEEYRKQYVSRGGFKLKGIIDTIELSVQGHTCLDVGISTGGFSDCLLQEGASELYGFDVGYGQLDWKLRSNPKVHLYERVNFRALSKEELLAYRFRATVAVMDVSFISATLMLQNICALFPEQSANTSSFLPSPLSWEKRKEQIARIAPSLSDDLFSSMLPDTIKGVLLTLVKPQFELGREKVGKGGLVKDSRLHAEAIEKVAEAACKNGMLNYTVLPSDIKGGKGNQEFLLLSYLS